MPAKIATFRREQIEDASLTRMQDSIEEVVESISSKAELNTVLLKDVKLEVNTGNVVKHGLGQKCSGYYLVKSSKFILLRCTKMTDTSLTLETTVADTVDLVVY